MSDVVRTDGLSTLVEAWVPQQRWFAGHGRTIASIELRELASLEAIHLIVAAVAYDDGVQEHYLVPLVLYPQPSNALEYVQLGSVETEHGTLWVYDALHDKDVTGVWIRGIQDAESDGVLSFHRYAEPDHIPVGASSLPMNAEQSNTSLIFDDVAILKVFRRLQPGVNPDIEVLQALTEQGGAHVAQLLGYVTAQFNGETYAIATLQEYLTTASDGWELARASVRDLLASPGVHAEEAGGDFAGEAERLGLAVAEVHKSLAAAFGTRAATTDEIAARTSTMHERLTEAIAIVPELAPLADGLRARFDAFAASADELAVQRVHGDLHLGQVLRTVRRWVVIDFEGEPMSNLDQRRAERSVLHDIAGMLRSFDYAAQHRIMELAQDQGVESIDDPDLHKRAAEWSQRNCAAFLDGYQRGVEFDPRAFPIAMSALIADKAVYEAVYEARHRPSWVRIPLSSLAELAEQ